MSNHTPDPSRRRFIQLTVAGLAAAPFAEALLGGVALAADMVPETDPMAMALGYKEDATKADKRTDKTALCSNCMHYTGKPGETSGPCALFQGKAVTANGWCTAWAKKAA